MEGLNAYDYEHHDYGYGDDYGYGYGYEAPEYEAPTYEMPKYEAPYGHMGDLGHGHGHGHGHAHEMHAKPHEGYLTGIVVPDWYQYDLSVKHE